MKKVLLTILDGFGISDKDTIFNNANMPNYKKLLDNYPNTMLDASGRFIGLPTKCPGNSDIGHTTIGIGRVLKRHIVELEDLFDNNELEDNSYYFDMIKNREDIIHIMALVTDSKIHSDINIILKMIDKLHDDNIDKLYLHIITDGIDTNTKSSVFIEQIQKKLDLYKIGKIASVCGRYYAMDRDKNWDRTKRYSDLITMGKGKNVSNFNELMDILSKNNDSSLEPLILDKNGVIKNNQTLLCLNFRSDRVYQILSVLVDIKFNLYDTLKMNDLKVYTFYKMPELRKVKYLINETKINNSLGEYISLLGLSQARIANIDAFADVTYFFDGGIDLKLDNCDRFMIKSEGLEIKNKPCVLCTKQVIKCMDKDYDLIVLNLSDIELLDKEHVNKLKETLELMDICLGKIIEVADDNFYTLIVTSSNSKFDGVGLVPFIMCDKKVKLTKGSLSNIAPTILKYMDIAVPKEMVEEDLYEK